MTLRIIDILLLIYELFQKNDKYKAIFLRTKNFDLYSTVKYNFEYINNYDIIDSLKYVIILLTIII